MLTLRSSRSTCCYQRLALTLLVFAACSPQIHGQQSENFPEPYNSEPEQGWISPAEALGKLNLPAGFRASLFAAEPDVQNPIAATLDSNGRVWIAENYTYAERSQRFDLNLNDRVVVLEDRDGDGVSDSRHVFVDSVKMLTGIAVGQGGVWLMCPPQLLFIPDSDGDLVPDGPPQVKLDGFHVARENYHNFANGLSWGPDGWLVGRCGASCPGEMGLPGTIDAERVPLRGGVWRYHPQRQIVEALTHGTTNPWGHDWNELGELFFINTVNGHLWHAIPGAHFVRPHTLDANPYVYELLDMHADHWHFDTGRSWTESRDGAANDFGGGHAHVGMMIYNSSHWPLEYHGKLMTINMHGRRVNVEDLEASGSGYVAHHAPDFALSDDLWFRGMDLLPMPDGNVLLIDWCDAGECHDHTGVHRTSGRIFKISYGEQAFAGSATVPLEAATRPEALAPLIIDGTEWASRRARESLKSMFLKGIDCSPAIAPLRTALQADSSTSVQRLRGMWGLYQLDQLQPSELHQTLRHPDPAVRSWSIRLLTDHWPIDNSDGSRPLGRSDQPDPKAVEAIIAIAQNEPSAAVRLTLASTLQRLPFAQRPSLARALMQYAEDADDHNLPLIVWYGLTPLGNDHLGINHLGDLGSLIADCQWPTTRRLLARRVADKVESQPKLFQAMLSQAADMPASFQADIIQGVAEGLAGRQKVSMPQAWPTIRRNLEKATADAVDAKSLSDKLSQLDVLFGDGRAMEELMQMVSNTALPLEHRRDALRTLVSGRAPGLKALCLQLLGDRSMNLLAAEGLALEQGDDVGMELIKRFRSFAPWDRARVVSILATRPGWAASLLSAVAEGQIQRDEISAYDARQIANLGNPGLTEQLAEVWGQVRESPAERRAAMDRIRMQLAEPGDVDLAKGRTLFDQNCSACHTMFGSGGKLGPDLTGAQRSDMNYLLDNIIDPSAVVTKEFRATIAMLQDGRVLTGLATSQTDELLTLATQTETHRIPMAEIEEIKLSTASTMPDGLLNSLSTQQLRDLFGYLQTKQQVEPTTR